MLGFLRRAMSGALLTGARGYMLKGERDAEDLRGWLALALVGTPLGTRDMWSDPTAALDQALSDFEKRFIFVRDVAFDISYQHGAISRQAKRVGNKAAMYGYSIVANWLQAVSRRDEKQQQQHREFICAVLQNSPQMLTRGGLKIFKRAMLPDRLDTKANTWRHLATLRYKEVLVWLRTAGAWQAVPRQRSD